MSQSALTMRLPAIDRRSYLKQAHDDGVLWRPDTASGSLDDRFQGLLSALLMPMAGASALWRLRSSCAAGLSPSVGMSDGVICQLIRASRITRPLVRADLAFHDLVALQGAAIAQAAFCFTSPIMTLAARAIQVDPALDLLPAWLNGLGWNDLVAHMRRRDIAAQAILAGQAVIDDVGEAGRVIRLRGSCHEA